MSDELLTVLGSDAEEVEKMAPRLGERELRNLYEVLVLARTIDEHCGSLQEAGKLSFWVPSGAVAAISAGAALALDDNDWLYPSFRDSAAFLLRGGSVEQLVAQLLAGVDDPQQGRQMPCHASLPDGRFVSFSGVVAAHVHQAAGTALAMKLRDEQQVVLASCGGGAVAQAAFHNALDLAARFEAPIVFLVRSDGSPNLAQRAGGYGIAHSRVDGGDVLAVYKAVEAARQEAVGGGPRMVAAILHEDQAGDPAHRLRPFLEHRGLWDPGQEEELYQRCSERVAAAIEVAESMGSPAAITMFDDVYATRPWMLEEQAEEFESEQRRRAERPVGDR